MLIIAYNNDVMKKRTNNYEVCSNMTTFDNEK